MFLKIKKKTPIIYCGRRRRRPLGCYRRNARFFLLPAENHYGVGTHHAEWRKYGRERVKIIERQQIKKLDDTLLFPSEMRIVVSSIHAITCCAARVVGGLRLSPSSVPPSSSLSPYTFYTRSRTRYAHAEVYIQRDRFYYRFFFFFFRNFVYSENLKDARAAQFSNFTSVTHFHRRTHTAESFRQCDR